MTKKTSMSDIAARLGVTKNTVSLALRGYPGVNEKTRQEIIAAAAEMGYVYKREAAGGGVSLERPGICLLQSQFTYSSQGFYSHIQFAVEKEARKNGLSIMLHCFDESVEEMDIPLCIRNGQASGVLVLGRISREGLEQVLSWGLPAVVADHYYEQLPVDTVLTDNLSGGFAAARYLLDQGHRKIGFCGDIRISNSFYDRYDGYCRAMAQAGLAAEQAGYVFRYFSFEEAGRGDMALAVERLSSMGETPTAFVCCNDSEAAALMKALGELGLKVPEDISVIGFDDADFASRVTPELTTFRVNKEELGREALIRLMELMEAGAPGLPKKILLPVSLVERQSVRQAGE